MRLQPRLFLADANTTPLKVGVGLHDGPVLVLARHLCVYARLPAAGLTRANAANAVRLQLPRISPFEDAQAFFVQSAGWLHVWSWSKRQVQAALASVADPDSAQIWPASLFAERATAVRIVAKDGVETLHFSSAGLVQSVFEFDASTRASVDPVAIPNRIRRWQKWCPLLPWQVYGQITAPSQGMAAAQDSAPRAGRLWLASGVLVCSVGATALGWFSHQRNAAKGDLAITVAQIRTKEAVAAANITSSALGRVAAPSWAPELARQLNKPILPVIIAQLQRQLSARRLLVRELRLEQSYIQVTLVGSGGGAPPIDEAIAALEDSNLGSVAFLEANASNGSVKLELRLSGFAKLHAPEGGKI